MQESLKRDIAVRSVAKSFQLTIPVVCEILKDDGNNYPIQPFVAIAYMSCLSAIAETRECCEIEFYGILSDVCGNSVVSQSAT